MQSTIDEDGGGHREWNDRFAVCDNNGSFYCRIESLARENTMGRVRIEIVVPNRSLRSLVNKKPVHPMARVSDVSRADWYAAASFGWYMII